MKRLLFLTLQQPWPARNGAELRSWHMVKALSKRFDVDVIGYYGWGGLTPDDFERIAAVARVFPGVTRHPSRDPWCMKRGAWAVRAGLRHPTVEGFASDEYAWAVRRALAERRYHALHVDHTLLARYRGLAAMPAILGTHNVESDVARQLAGMAVDPRLARMQADSFAREEGRWLRAFDRVSAVSQLDAERMTRAFGIDPPVVAANGVDVAAYAGIQPTPDRPTLLYVGQLGYAPNRLAVDELLERILPRVVERVPAVRLLLVGGHAPADALARWQADPRVQVTGLVPDVAPYLAQGSVAVVPLRQGGGTRLKILESMAAGVPVVSTPLGQEGLGLVDGEHLRVADAPEALADAAVEALEHPDLARARATAARAFVAERYDWSRTLLPHVEAVEALTARP